METEYKSFVEQQEKYSDLCKQFDSVVSQINTKEFDRKSSILTLRELTPLPSTTPVYQAVGKAFVSKNIKSVSESLTDAVTKSGIEANSLTSLAESLQKRIHDSEVQLQDMASKLNVQK